MEHHLYAGATHHLVGGQHGLRHDPVLDRVAGVIWHLSASEAPSLRRYFDGPSGGVESHFHVPRTLAHPIEQYRPGNREADANYRGNSWVQSGERWGFLSIEFQGADPATGRYTDHQVEQGLAITEWACRQYGFARRVAPGYRSEGVGYHVQHGSGPGTNSWSNATGKTCPGSPRIRQLLTEVFPRFIGGVVAPLPVEPAPLKPTTPPPWPLPHGWYFGPKSGPRESVSGYFSHRASLRLWQQRMENRGWRITPDGLYGPETARTARLFGRQVQAQHADGMVRRDIWNAAWTAPIT